MSNQDPAHPANSASPTESSPLSPDVPLPRASRSVTPVNHDPPVPVPRNVGVLAAEAIYPLSVYRAKVPFDTSSGPDEYTDPPFPQVTVLSPLPAPPYSATLETLDYTPYPIKPVEIPAHYPTKSWIASKEVPRNPEYNHQEAPIQIRLNLEASIHCGFKTPCVTCTLNYILTSEYKYRGWKDHPSHLCPITVNLVEQLRSAYGGTDNSSFPLMCPSCLNPTSQCRRRLVDPDSPFSSRHAVYSPVEVGTECIQLPFAFKVGLIIWQEYHTHINPNSKAHCASLFYPVQSVLLKDPRILTEQRVRAPYVWELGMRMLREIHQQDTKNPGKLARMVAERTIPAIRQSIIPSVNPKERIFPSTSTPLHKPRAESLLNQSVVPPLTSDSSQDLTSSDDRRHRSHSPSTPEKMFKTNKRRRQN